MYLPNQQQQQQHHQQHHHQQQHYHPTNFGLNSSFQLHPQIQIQHHQQAQLPNNSHWNYHQFIPHHQINLQSNLPHNFSSYLQQQQANHHHPLRPLNPSLQAQSNSSISPLHSPNSTSTSNFNLRPNHNIHQFNHNSTRPSLTYHNQKQTSIQSQRPTIPSPKFTQNLPLTIISNNGTRKKIKVRLPLEFTPDHLLQFDESRIRSKWFRKPIINHHHHRNNHDDHHSLLEVISKDQWPEKHNNKLPNSIDVYLPGKEVWDDYRAEILDEKLILLGYPSNNPDFNSTYADLKVRLEAFLTENPSTTLSIPTIPGIYPLISPPTPISPIPKPLMSFSTPITPRGHSSTMSIALPGGTPNQYSFNQLHSPTSPITNDSLNLPKLKPTAHEFKPFHSGLLTPTAPEFKPSTWAPAPFVGPVSIRESNRSGGNSPHRMTPHSPQLMNVGEEEEEEEEEKEEDNLGNEEEEDIVTDSEPGEVHEAQVVTDSEIDEEEEQSIERSIGSSGKILGGSHYVSIGSTEHQQPLSPSSEGINLNSKSTNHQEGKNDDEEEEEDNIPLAELQLKRRDTLQNINRTNHHQSSTRGLSISAYDEGSQIDELEVKSEYTNPSDEEELINKSSLPNHPRSDRSHTFGSNSLSFNNNVGALGQPHDWIKGIEIEGDIDSNPSEEGSLSNNQNEIPITLSSISPFKSTPTSRYLLTSTIDQTLNNRIDVGVGRATGSAIIISGFPSSPRALSKLPNSLSSSSKVTGNGNLNAFAPEFKPNFTFSSKISSNLNYLKDEEIMNDDDKVKEEGSIRFGSQFNDNIRGIKRQKSDQEVWLSDNNEDDETKKFKNASFSSDLSDLPSPIGISNESLELTSNLNIDEQEQDSYERPGKDNMKTFKFPTIKTNDNHSLMVEESSISSSPNQVKVESNSTLPPPFSLPSLPSLPNLNSVPHRLPPIMIPNSPLLKHDNVIENEPINSQSNLNSPNYLKQQSSFELIPTQPPTTNSVVSLTQLKAQKKEWSQSGLINSFNNSYSSSEEGRKSNQMLITPRLNSAQKKRGCIPNFAEDNDDKRLIVPNSPTIIRKKRISLETFDGIGPSISIRANINNNQILGEYCNDINSNLKKKGQDDFRVEIRSTDSDEAHMEAEEEQGYSESTNGEIESPISGRTPPTPGKQRISSKRSKRSNQMMERILDKKLKELRKDLIGCQNLKLNLDTLKRDELLNEMNIKIENLIQNNFNRIFKVIKDFNQFENLEEITIRLSEAVKPQIYQLINLTSDKVETAKLIVEQLKPNLLILSNEIKNDLKEELQFKEKNMIKVAEGKEVEEKLIERILNSLKSINTLQTNEINQNIVESFEKRSNNFVNSINSKLSEIENSIIIKIIDEINEINQEEAINNNRGEVIELLQQLNLKSLNSYQDLNCTMNLNRNEIITEIKKNIEKLKDDEILKLKLEKNELESSLIKSRSEHGKVRSERSVEKEKQIEEKNKLESLIKTLENQKQELNKENEFLKLKNLEHEISKQKLNDDLISKDKEIQKLNQINYTIEKKCENLEVKELEWQSKKFEHNEIVGELKIQMKMLESDIKGSNRRTELSTIAYERLQSERNEDLLRFQTKEDELRLELRKLDKESKVLLRQSELELREALEVKASLEGEVRSLEQRVNKLDEQIVGLRDMSAAKQQSLATVNQRLFESERRAKEVESLRNENSKLQSEVKELEETRNQLKLMELEKVEAENQVKDYRIESEGVKLEVEKMYETVSKELEEAHSKNVVLEKQLINLNQDYENIKDELNKTKFMNHQSQNFIKSDILNGYPTPPSQQHEFVKSNLGYPTPPTDFIKSNIPLSSSIHAPNRNNELNKLVPPPHLHYHHSNKDLGSRKKSFTSGSSNDGTVRSLGAVEGTRPPSPSPSRASSRATMDDEGWWSAD
ncbi:hypothetical protein CROQUDRAFT_86812 [Cronartium quercuum f. sp. fusiforme G11]|uniref:Uncharacterized protein n=1 Tax=Cronartium quercuum f. sp. fusiforme G11 TaxID=708437 RepID=A0A9P6NSG7_9BASI|nr:hypothetical protein CROQUDRAFT_86812 [Cronartium quercuum f. sp. fusiforme G11]